MEPLSRRRFIQASGATAGAAIVAAKATSASAGAPEAASSVTSDASVAPTVAADTTSAGEPLMLFVSDPLSGQVAIMHGGHEVVYHDPQLVARVQSVVRNALV